MTTGTVGSEPAAAPAPEGDDSPWRVPRLSYLVALLAGVWLVLGLAITLLSVAPDAGLAERLHDSGVRVTAGEVQEELSRDNVRRTVEATFRTRDGEQVTAELRGAYPHLGESEPRDAWRSTWRPGSYQYAAPLPVTYDPARPADAMATEDVDRLRDGGAVRRGWVQVLVCVGAIGLAVLNWLLAVTVRVLRRRRVR